MDKQKAPQNKYLSLSGLYLHVTPHILVKVVSKFHSPSPSSLGAVRGRQPSVIKKILFYIL